MNLSTVPEAGVRVARIVTTARYFWTFWLFLARDTIAQ